MNDFKNAYDKLNLEQKHAVDAIEGPVLVLAGPGTGKTQILSMRIANILLKTDTPPESILALTFTESGVRAMKERLFSIIGLAAYKVSIHTFHSFCADIIRSNPEEFISRSELEQLTDIERISIFKSIIDNEDLHVLRPFNAPYFYLQTIISKIKELKREGVSTSEYLELINTSPELQLSLENTANLVAVEKDRLKNLELYKVYVKYQEILNDLGKFDFEDMINLVLLRFNENTGFLRIYQERYLYTLVDEFQDTNSSQAKLLYKLNEYWGDVANLFVVGDDNQSIYRFQGASTENILGFLKRFPQSKKIDLVINYRSLQPIIDASYNVVKNNKLAVTKENRLLSEKSKTEVHDSKLLYYTKFKNNYIENYFLVKKIQELLDENIKPSGIAIIYRNNSDSQDIADLLARFNIRYTIEGGSNILESGVVIRFLHLLRVISKISKGTEDLELFALLNYDFTEIDSFDVIKLSRFATKKKINLIDGLIHVELDKDSFKNIDKIQNFIGKLVVLNKLADNKTFLEFVDIVLDESGFLSWVLNEPNYFELLNKINSLLNEIKRLTHTDKKLTLEKFLDYINVMAENNISINEETLNLSDNKVRLMTAHKSKGLEFDYVFIPKFIEKKWSNAFSRNLINLPKAIVSSLSDVRVDDKSFEIEEERRLFYVALTRAKKGVYVSCSTIYSTSSTKENIESMFLHEIPEDLTEKLESSKTTEDFNSNFPSLFDPIPVKEYSDEEKNFLRSALADFKLSASSLNTYLECSYKFKLDFVLNTPKTTEKPLALGSAIHKALELAAKKLKTKNKVDLDFLVYEYENALKKEILSDKDFREILKEGKSILTTYFETYKKEFVENENILFIEKFFGYGYYRPILNNIPLSGRIDRIELTDPDLKIAKVRDYKTGKPKTRNEILGKAAGSTGAEYRQLLFYKLLTDLDRSIQYKINEVELDFIGNRNTKPKREAFFIDENDLSLLKTTISDVYKSILSLKFERTKSYHVCKTCRFKYHCWPDGIPISSESQLSLDL